jgi:hypothetical protein
MRSGLRGKTASMILGSISTRRRPLNGQRRHGPPKRPAAQAVSSAPGECFAFVDNRVLAPCNLPGTSHFLSYDLYIQSGVPIINVLG